MNVVPIDRSCTELVLFIRFKELSREDQKLVGNLINYLSGHLKDVPESNETPAQAAQ